VELDHPAPPRRRRLRGALRRLGVVLGWTAAGLVTVVALAVLLPPGRRALLCAGLDLVDRSLPGDLSSERAVWPGLGRLELDGLVWVDGPDTLARADTLRLALDVTDLLHRDLTVRRLVAAGIAADVPAIRRRLPAAGPPERDQAPADRAGGPALLRAGSLPPLPSIAVERFALRRLAVATAPYQVVRVDSLTASLELRGARAPRFAAALRARPRDPLGVVWRLAGEVGPDTLVLDLAPLHLGAPAELPEPAALSLAGRLALPRAAAESLLAGRLDWPVLDLRAFSIAGDLGSWRLDASLDGRAPGTVTLHSHLPAAPAALLAQLAGTGVDSLAPGTVDTLAARWARGGEPGLDLRLDVVPPSPPAAAAALQLCVRGAVRLPAPAALAPLLPPQLAVDDLGPIVADLDLRYDGQAGRPHVTARLDLGRTAWLEAARIVIAGDTTRVRLDSLAVALPGLAVQARGRASRDSVQAHVELRLPDASLLERWRDPALAGAKLDVTAVVDAAGPWPLPHVDLALRGTAASPLVTIPSLALDAIVAPDTVVLALDLPAGLHAAAGDLDAAALEFAGATRDSLREVRGAFHLGARAGPARLVTAGRIRVEDVLTLPAGALTVDTLLVAYRNREVASRGPWQATFALADSTASVRGLRLTGDLGEIALDGAASPDSVVANVALALRATRAAIVGHVPASARANLPAGTLTADGEVAIAGSLREPWATGRLRLGVADQPELAGLHAEAHLALGGAGTPPPGLEPGPDGWRGRAARVDLTLHDADTLLVRISALAPLPRPQAVADSVDVRVFAAALDLARLDPLLPWRPSLSGRLDLDARAIGVATVDTTVPLLDLAGGIRVRDLRLATAEGAWLRLDGEVDVAGTTREPRLRGSLVLGLRAARDALLGLLPPEADDWLPAGTLTADGEVAVDGPLAAPWAAGRLRLGVADNPELAGLRAETSLTAAGAGAPPPGLEAGRAGWREHAARVELSLRDADTLLVRVAALAPLPRPGAAADSAAVQIVAHALDLARLARLLPTSATLSGRLDLDAHARGVITPDAAEPQLDLAGGLRARDVRLRAADGSWLALGGEGALAGATRAPVVRGGLELAGGLIRLPEPPPALLPATGDALLWRANPAGVDSLAASVSDSVTAPASAAAFLPDLIFTVRCPGALWLRGQGLDVELSGDLSVHLREGRLGVDGELEAKQGTMRQLGRVFRLQRGRVVFYADDDDLDPALDLALGVAVGEYQITITLTGTASEPELEFTSSPELGDGDIISVLLFGKTADGLDEGQSGLMAERASQIAVAYGSVKLQESMARELGVDVLMIAPREGDEETNALTVGKYLSPKVLVRYERTLSEESAFFVHLDYHLTANQEWKAHTQVSQGEESGLELRWEKDW